MRSERARLANLVTLVTAVAGVALFVQGPLFWLAALLVVGAAAFGAFNLFVELDPRGVPVESLATPAAATFATVGIAHLAGPTLAGLVSLGLGGALVALALLLEGRMIGPADAAQPRRQQQLVLLSVLLAFLCFAAIAGAQQAGAAAGLPAPTGRGAEAVVGLAILGGAVVAFVLGYRLSAIRSASVRQAAWSAGTYAVVIAVAAGFVRAIGLPIALGPALLAAVFYLWSAYRSASQAERRSSGWLTEYVALAAAAILAVAWNLLLR